MPIRNYYPSLSDLIALDFLPGDLILPVNFFDAIFYKNLSIETSKYGEKSSYYIEIVSSDLRFDLFETGLELIINPNADNITESIIPIELNFQLEILKYVNQFDFSSFSPDAQSFFNLLMDIVGVLEEDLLEKAIDFFIDDTSKVQYFINEYNAFPNKLITLTTTSDISVLIGELTTNNISIFQVVYDFFIENSDDPIESIKDLFFLWIGTFSVANLLSLVTPKFSISLNTLELALAFPRNWLQPLDSSGNVIPGNEKSLLSFNVGSLSYSSETGLDLKGIDPTISLSPSKIGNTPLVIAASGIKIDLQDDSNIPEATADGRPNSFKGIFIESASIGLLLDSDKFPDATTVSLYSKNLLVGNEGGISGTIGVTTSFESDPHHWSGLILDPADPEIIFSVADKSLTITGGKRLILGDETVTTVEDPEIIPMPISGLINVRDANGVYYSVVLNADGATITITEVIPSTRPISLQFGDDNVLTLDHFSVTLHQNEVVASDISGTLEMPSVQGGITLFITVDISNGFKITFESDPAFTITDNSIFGFTVDLLEIEDTQDFFQIALGKLSPASIGGALTNNIKNIPFVNKFIPRKFQIDYLGFKKYKSNYTGITDDQGINYNLLLSWDNGISLPISNIGSSNNQLEFKKLIDINSNTEGGLVKLQALEISIKSEAQNGVSASMSLKGAKLKIGDFLNLKIDGLGLGLVLKESETGNGIIGPFDLDYQIVGPTGIALKIKTGSVDGGGFISLDKEKGLYSGGLELEINNKIQVTAIGLLVTKLPSGNPGYSFIALINASFPDVPLGFGFTLSAVGAVLGLNRGMDLQVIQNKVYSGTINDLLFPTDVVNKSDKILTDINGAFPVAEGRFVIGLLANIAWGYPKKIIGEIGLMVELPSPIKIALLGKIHIVLPDPFQTKLILNIAFLGAYDAEKKTISFDACLYDSRFSNYTLSGDLSFRHVGGENPNFLLTAGGFHPSYTPPPLGLPSLRRLTVNIINKQKIKVDMQAYLALTSNTAQVGASVTLFSQITDNITADGYLGFDALFQFHPFYFTFEASAQLAVKRKSKNVLSINVNVKVQGPNPWSVYGHAEFEICKINLSLSFNETWGNSATNSLQDVAILPLLIEALKDKHNWNVDILDHKNQLVTFREIDSTDLIVQPTSILSVKQNVVPFKTTLASFGTQKPSDGSRFMISKIYIGPHGANDPVTQSEDLTEYFAPAQFLNLSISEKLSRKSFEKFPAGVKFKGTENLAFPKIVLKQVEYETIIVDKPDDIRIIDKQIYPLQAELAVDFDRYLLGNDVSTSSASNRFKKPTPTVVQNQERFVITNTKDLQQESQETFDNMNDAFEAMLSIIQNDPKRENQLQVMSEYELV